MRGRGARSLWARWMHLSASASSPGRRSSLARCSNGLLHRCCAFKQSLTSPSRSLSLLRTGHLTLDVKARREFLFMVSLFQILGSNNVIWKRASLMMQYVTTVSKGRLGQVDSKMGEHVQGGKKWGGGGIGCKDTEWEFPNH